MNNQLRFKEIQDSEIGSAAALIVNEEGKVLAFARDGNPNNLGLIAGSRERDPISHKFNESPFECMHRELREELITSDLDKKIQVKPSDFIFEEEPIYVAKPQDDHPYCATYMVKYIGSQKYFPIIFYHEDSYIEDSKVIITKLEGYAMWVDPKDIISNEMSAFKEYNTELLRIAGLIKEM